MKPYPELFAGDIGAGKGKKYSFPYRASQLLILPKTTRHHFFLLGEYIPDEDDYVILESINKGIAVGRLSFYKSEDIEIYRINDKDWKEIGKKATLALTKYGRARYDFILCIRLILSIPRLIIKHGFPPWLVQKLPYYSDGSFICTEAVRRGFKDTGHPIIEKGVLPIGASYKQAFKRGKLLRIFPEATG